MENLSFIEMVSLNGGSQESYENGKEAGAAVRECLEEASLAYFVVSVVVAIFFHVKV